MKSCVNWRPAKAYLLSTLARDLIREAIELREDVALVVFAAKRMKTFDRTKALYHDKTWE
jgi:hypothetical protein